MSVYEVVFSPTGGTKKVTDILVDHFKLDGRIFNYDDEVEFIDLSNPEKDYNKIIFNKEDLVFIALPTFGGRAVSTGIKRLEKLRGCKAKAVVITTYGNRDYDDSLLEIYDTAKKAGFIPIAGVAAITEHSILPQYGTNRPDMGDIRSLNKFAKEITDKLNNKDPEIPGKRPYLKPSNISLIPKSTKNCDECNICVELCPVKAIDRNTRSTNKEDCISCMRCVKFCPSEARKTSKIMSKIAALVLKRSASKRKEYELFL